MLEPNDLRQIGEEMGKVIEQNVTPALDSLNQRIERIEAEMVTKSYLDDKLADIRGEFIARLNQRAMPFA